MKKLIAIGLSMAMTLTGTLNAFAAGRVNTLAQNSTDEGIQVVYNSDYLDFDDVQPQNIDGRVMIPFRAALEGMGAAVDYDNATRIVTAEKGDTTITFTLLDDTIYIDDNGEKSEITMDVPMVVEDGSTLVPIRFMSEAFGMNVGWSNKTVLILDKDEIIKDFKVSSPNLAKLMELDTPAYNSSSAEFSLAFTVEHGDDYDWASETNNDTKVNATVNMTTAASENAAKIKLNFDLGIVYEDVNIDIKDATADIIISDGKIYIKTDAIQKLSDNLDLSGMISFMAAMSGNSWFSIDLKSLFDEADISDEAEDIYANLLQNAGNYALINTVFSMLIPNDRDIRYSDIHTVNLLLDTYEELDKFINISETKDGYSVKLDISDGEFIDMINRIVGEDMSDEDYAEADEMLDFDISVSADYGETASIEESMNFAFDDLYGVKITFDMNISGTSETLEEVDEPIVPESSIDLMESFIKMLKSPI